MNDCTFSKRPQTTNRVIGCTNCPLMRSVLYTRSFTVYCWNIVISKESLSLIPTDSGNRSQLNSLNTENESNDCGFSDKGFVTSLDIATVVK